VTGPSGEEIHVDTYGRIKVQFHWDRDGKQDDKTSCWVRTMMPWTGKNWGMVALPRIGQEVVIQFEEGDPDRPLCVGMLYNADTMPPYDLPADATMSGVKTNSSKGGGGYNELVMEDKKGDELVRFMAEKDYVQNVQNQAHIKVGYDHPKDVRKAEALADKSMKLEVHTHLDEIVETGNHTFTVLSGQQEVMIEQEQITTINKNSETTVKDDLDITVTDGNMGTAVNKGDFSVSADMGHVKIDAAQSITLTCGASSITLDPGSITMESVKIDIKAQAALSAQASGTAELKSSGMTTVKGSLVQIN
jgi:type VI secretion system secreted protein VgrG